MRHRGYYGIPRLQQWYYGLSNTLDGISSSQLRYKDALPWILRNLQATTIVLWLAEYSGWYLERPTELQRRAAVDITESPGYNNSHYGLPNTLDGISNSQMGSSF